MHIDWARLWSFSQPEPLYHLPNSSINNSCRIAITSEDFRNFGQFLVKLVLCTYPLCSFSEASDEIDLVSLRSEHRQQCNATTYMLLTAFCCKNFAITIFTWGSL